MEHKKTILVVDSDKGTRLLARVTLENGEYPVIEAVTGQAALAAIRYHRPALVIVTDPLEDMPVSVAVSGNWSWCYSGAWCN